MVEISVGWGGQLEGTETDIVQSLVVNTVGLVCVLDQLMDGQGGVVGLDNCVRYLRGWNSYLNCYIYIVYIV